MQNRKSANPRASSKRVADSPALPVIDLPKPAFTKDMPVMKALRQRMTVREISDKPLALQMLSNLLWAAYGVNREVGPFGLPGRTAASASNSQEIDLYVAMREGVYRYDEAHHRLDPVVAGDLRPMAIGRGQGGMGAGAPVRLLYVVDIDKLTHTKGFQEPGLQDGEVQKSYYFVDTGIIAGNVAVFAAAQGLAAWFHNCDKAGLAKKLNLSGEKKVLFGQTVGWAEE